MALLKWIQADYICPGEVVFLANPHPHLSAYFSALQPISTGQLAVAGLSTAAQRAGAQRLAAALAAAFGGVLSGTAAQKAQPLLGGGSRLSTC